MSKLLSSRLPIAIGSELTADTYNRFVRVLEINLGEFDPDTTRQIDTTLRETVFFNPGTVVWYEARIQNNDANATDYGTGLVETFTGSSGWRSANRISIESNNGEQFYRFVTKNASGTTQTQYTAYTITDSAYDTVGFRVDRAKNVQFFVNRTLAATHTANINTDDMQMFAASVSASASGQRVTKLDYITATQNRNASELINNI